MPAKVWVPVVAVIYFLVVVMSDGRALAWTWYALVWVWGLAPFPMTLMMVVFPLLFGYAILSEHSALPMRGEATRGDRRRRNPPEPKNVVPRKPTPPVKEPEPSSEQPNTEQTPKEPPLDVWVKPERPSKGPRQEYTVKKKPPTPKIWGIDP